MAGYQTARGTDRWTGPSVPTSASNFQEDAMHRSFWLEQALAGTADDPNPVVAENLSLTKSQPPHLGSTNTSQLPLLSRITASTP